MDKPISAHSFRHGLVTLALDAGALHVVQTQRGMLTPA
jgi:integrase